MSRTIVHKVVNERLGKAFKTEFQILGDSPQMKDVFKAMKKVLLRGQCQGVKKLH